MAKKKATPYAPQLFEHVKIIRERRLRRQHALFIPRYLSDAADNQQLSGIAQDRAYAIALRWADLESSGKLATLKETSIDTQFLDQLFGEGLGYSVKTTSPDAWQLEHKFTVPGVGTADAALGEFTVPPQNGPSVVIELKDASKDLDRDRSNGRTAVQQCWDYLNALPHCPWGIVSNFSIIRLYHRSKGLLTYEEFTLQELRDRLRFNEFYCLFERGGLLPSKFSQLPRAALLLEQTQNRQKEVGDELYTSYQYQRLRLIEHLNLNLAKPLDEAIRISQKLLDRLIFIAFCEDRGLLFENCIARAAKDTLDDFGVENPCWKKFLGLFREVDKGGKLVGIKTGYNGGLFAPDPAIDSLDLDDVPWTEGFATIGTFDFSEEVNVEVLGHLFERSITELEKLRIGGLFALKGAVAENDPYAYLAAPAPPPKPVAQPNAPALPDADDDESPLSKMPKSAQRKRFGIYYTPPAFTGLIVERTVDALVRERFAALAHAHHVDPESRENQDPKKLHAYWSACLDCLKSFTICDPACGSGAFLIRAYDALDAHYKSVVHGLAGTMPPTTAPLTSKAPPQPPRYADALLDDPKASDVPPDPLTLLEDSIPNLILAHNLYGVDLSREGVEITQLALWIRSARKGKTLMDLSSHIVHGNSLVSDPAVDPKALDWHKTFPAIFAKGGFDCVIGNPPWERVKLEEREFFALGSADIATAANASDRQKLIEKLEAKNPELWERYKAAQVSTTRTLDYVRRKDAGFPLTGKGDVNLYMLFAELAGRIVSPVGRVGILLPSGIATDHTTKEFFGALVETKTLTALYDFVNRLGLFPDVEGRLKFCVLLFAGSKLQSDDMDFVFWAEQMEDVETKSRHVVLSARDIKLLNPNTRTCPIFRTKRDADLTKDIYKRVPILIDLNRREGGNPWGIRFLRMFDQTNDAGLFGQAKRWEKKGYKLVGNTFVKGKKRALPLLEAKMTRDYDHRASWIVMNDKNAYMNYTAESATVVEHQNPEYLPMPRYWVSESDILARAPASLSIAAIAFHDVARANDTRTTVACLVPQAGFTNTLPLIVNEMNVDWRRFSCLAGNVNSYVYDFAVRQKANNAHLNFFIVEQIPTLPPDTYAAKCPWSKRETLEHWISDRVLKLSCTADDMIPLAQACEFRGSQGNGVHIWNDQERAKLRAELDAAFFLLYGISREDAEYILTTFTNTGFIPPDQRDQQGTLWQHGSIGEMVLDAFDTLQSQSS